jgi:hypothetical protein
MGVLQIAMTHKHEQAKPIGVTLVFPLVQQGRLMVQLDSFQWDFKRFGHVDLCFSDRRIPMRYMAYGNVKGTAALALVPTEATGMSIRAIADAFEKRDPKTGAFLERTQV